MNKKKTQAEIESEIAAKQAYWAKQRQLRQQIDAAYDAKDYAKADALYEEMEALVDPDPDEILTGDEGLLFVD